MIIHCDICNQDKPGNGFKSIYNHTRKEAVTFCPDCPVETRQEPGAVLMDEGRKQDLIDITSKLKTERDPKKRLALQATASKISNESAKVRSMRHELVKAMREGTAENVRDINEWVAKRSDYK